METTIAVERVSRCGVPNKNNVVYSKEIFKNALNEVFSRNGYIPITVAKPDYFKNIDSSFYTVDLSNVVGKIKSIDDVEEVRLNITPMNEHFSDIIDQLIANGYRAGMRYTSSVIPGDYGILNVASDMKIIAYDLLSPDQHRSI